MEHNLLSPDSQEKNANCFADFRPISLTNTCCNVISKLLANKLKTILNKIISPNQTVFLEGRWINDNGILAQEVLHTMSTCKSKKGWSAVKIAFSKAFDRMEWTFMKKILENFGFNETFVNWIMQCMSSPTFSILINGTPTSFSTSSRGLRQGDQLSPYLFILAMEILSRMFHLAEQLSLIKGIKISRNNLPLSHLMFADDLMIFVRATASDARHCNIILNLFNKWSGQEINMNKSGILFSKFVRGRNKMEIKNILNLKKLNKDTKYLGNPLFIKRKKK